MQKHEEITRNFRVGEVLGSGAFATVFVVTKKTQSKFDGNHQFALKLVDVSRVVARRKNCCYDRPGSKGSDLENEKLDTQELFFPSRISDRKSLDGLQNNGNDGDERYKSGIYRSMMDILQREVKVHLSASSQQHPNIVSMLESFKFYSADKALTNEMQNSGWVVGMVMEYCSRGDLHSYLKKKRDAARHRGFFIGNEEAPMCKEHDTSLSMQYIGDARYDEASTMLDEGEARHMMRHILRGLAFLHSRGIVHRDIKAGNIMLSPVMNCPLSSSMSKTEFGRNHPTNQSAETDRRCVDSIEFSLVDCTLKIADFGLAVQMNEVDDWDEAQHTLCGTPSCLAPEVALSTPKPKLITMTKGNEKDEYGDDIMDFTGGKAHFDDSCPPNNDQRQFSCDTEFANHDINTKERGHGQPADLWSCGCILYASLVGRYPFSSPQPIITRTKDYCHLSPIKATRVQDTISRVIQGEWSIPDYVNMSKDALSLLKQLLSFEPQKRGFARGVLSTHSFFASTVNKSDRRQMKSRKPLSVLETIENNQMLYNAPNVCDIEADKKTNHFFLDVEAKYSYDLNQIKLENKIDTLLVNSKTASRTIKPPFATLERMHSCKENQNSKDLIVPVITQHSRHKGIIEPSYQDMYRNVQAYQKKIMRRVTGKNVHTDNTLIHSRKLILDCDIASPSPSSAKMPRFINPIGNIQRLPTIKHQWKELRLKYSNISGHKAKQCYTVFILPREVGLVIQCEEKGRRGAWMHITGNGSLVNTGRLSQSSTFIKSNIYSDLKGNGASPDDLITEAFLRRPKNMKFLHSTLIKPVNYQDAYQSLTKAGSLHNITLPSEFCSSRSFSTTRTVQNGLTFYKPLSSLLQKDKRPFLSLYRKLEKVVNHIKEQTPKLTLYIYSRINTVQATTKGYLVEVEEIFPNLICKSLLMENGPKPIIETVFVDSVIVRYNMLTRSEDIIIQNKNKEEVISLAPDSMMHDGKHYKSVPKQYSHYIKLARVAVKKALESVESFSLKSKGSKKEVFPIIRRIVVNGKSCDDWIDVTNFISLNSNGTEKVQTNEVHALKDVYGRGLVNRQKCLLDYLVSDSMPLTL